MSKGDRIKDLRKAKGITQVEMARLLSTTKQTISKYEKGIVTNIPSDRIEAMAKILYTTPEYILGWEEREKDNEVLADIIVRMRTDADFRALVESLYRYDSAKIQGIRQMLRAFDE